jgi:acyl-CoA dehydrogenase
MEVLVRYGTAEQKRQWLEPLLAAKIRSCFAMTEPDVASSDATNIQSTITREADDYVINGASGGRRGGDPRCRIAIFMGASIPDAPEHKQQSMILVPMDDTGVCDQANAAGVRVRRRAARARRDRVRHVRVPASKHAAWRGPWFEIAQDGSDRAHSPLHAGHWCCRAGVELMCTRVSSRRIRQAARRAGHDPRAYRESRIEIEQARLLTLRAPVLMDTVGNKAARSEIAQIKSRGAADGTARPRLARFRLTAAAG